MATKAKYTEKAIGNDEREREIDNERERKREEREKTARSEMKATIDRGRRKSEGR